MAARWFAWLAVLTVAGWCVVTPAAPVPASEIKTRTEPVPRQLQGVGVDEHLGQALPLDLPFVEETGRAVRLRDYFDGKRPVIVTMNYSNCPMLCSLELSGLVEALKGLSWSAGDQFRLVTVSFDPKETPAVASKTKQRYLSQYGRQGTEDSWHFLVGEESNVRALAEALGFRYRYDEAKDQYYHVAALAIVMPDGKIGRYLYGVKFPVETLRLSLVETSQGKIGSTLDRLILYCCAYDPKEGSYSLVANRAMTVGALLMLAVLATFLALMWLNERRKRHRLADQKG